MYKLKQCIVFVMVFLVAMLSFTSVYAEETTVVAVSSSASSAVLYEPSAGRVLYEKHAHIKRPMASTTKLMTALLAVERLAPDTVLTASSQALAVIGSSMGLRVGDTVTRDDLLHGLLLSSGNDAANVFALTMAESFEGFAALMNERAAELGMTNTRFVTPSGLDADGHGASAYDMALLAAKVLEHELLASICATASAQITVGGRQVTLTNHNKLLKMYPDAIGMKTGYTSQAGRCLVSAATRDGVTLIAVTLDCSNDWEEHMTLLDEGFSVMESVKLSPPSLTPLTVYGGELKSLKLKSSPVTVSVLSNDKAAIETVVLTEPFVWAPLQAGDIVGKVEYRLRGALLAWQPIEAATAIEEEKEKSWFWKTGQLFSALFCEAVT